MARRFGHHARGAARGAKGTAIGVAVGAGSALAVGKAMSISFLSPTTHWWAMPAALAVAGHFLKRKNAMIGDALIGIAGYQGYSNFISRPPAAAKGFIDAGFIDAGNLVSPGSTNYMDSPGTTSSLGTSASQNAGMLVNREVMGYGDAGALYDAQGLES
jgi:hypothetical protein